VTVIPDGALTVSSDGRRASLALSSVAVIDQPRWPAHDADFTPAMMSFRVEWEATDERVTWDDRAKLFRVTSYRVTLNGQAAGRSSFPANDGPARPADVSATPAADASRDRDRREPATGITAGIHAIQDWLAGLPRPLSAAIVISAFLIVINVLTGMHRMWFQWPVAVLLFMALLRTVLGRERRSDRRREERRANRE
jgi:hypothetical protein